jgi:hypothetical protein
MSPCRLGARLRPGIEPSHWPRMPATALVPAGPEVLLSAADSARRPASILSMLAKSTARTSVKDRRLPTCDASAACVMRGTWARIVWAISAVANTSFGLSGTPAKSSAPRETGRFLSTIAAILGNHAGTVNNGSQSQTGRPQSRRAMRLRIPAASWCRGPSLGGRQWPSRSSEPWPESVQRSRSLSERSVESSRCVYRRSALLGRAGSTRVLVSDGWKCCRFMAAQDSSSRRSCRPSVVPHSSVRGRLSRLGAGARRRSRKMSPTVMTSVSRLIRIPWRTREPSKYISTRWEPAGRVMPRST